MKRTEVYNPPIKAHRLRVPSDRTILASACILIAALYLSMANLKGIGTDEGFRLGIINGGREYSATHPGTTATWRDVLQANSPYAYQPLYFIVLNTVMRITHSHNELILKFVNVCFLWLSLQGLLALSRDWKLIPRLFLLGLFSLNSYLLMHVLQVREYIAGIAFYVWSTWLVLQLDRRTLGHSWKDTAWFISYGVLLTVGFYMQSWVVFPAVAQGLFLIMRPPGERLRFYANLAVSYVIVITCTWPYLQTHRQKVDIGQWGTEGTELLPRLVDGMRLILSGLPSEASFWNSLSLWIWLALLIIGASSLTLNRFRTISHGITQEYPRQVLLALLSLSITVAFQIGYFYKVDTLSVWPRYFAVHYFFLLWLVALAFKRMYELSTCAHLTRPLHLCSKAIIVAALIILSISGLHQVRTYYLQPYFDSGLSANANWRILSEGIAAIVKNGDVVVAQDFIHAWTLSFTRDWPNPITPEQKIGRGPFPEGQRFLYLWPDGNPTKREEIAGHFSSLGFSSLREHPMTYGEQAFPLYGWTILIFNRAP
jgi:hypothetical protein